MGISRKKKTIYNILTLFIYQMFNFACNLILPRLILGSYGSAYNGLVSSITQFLNFISILRLGVAGATRVELYKSLNNGDNDKTSSIVNATQKFMRKISFIFFCYLFLIAIIYPFIVKGFNFIDVFSLVLILGISVFCEYFFNFTYATLLQSDQKMYIHNIIQTAFTIINTVVLCILITNEFSIQFVKFISAIIFTISSIFLYMYVRKKYAINKYAIPDNTALKGRKDVMSNSIANIVHENTDIAVLTLMTDMKVVSVYAVYTLVINGLKKIVEIFTSSLESYFGQLWVKREYENLNKKLCNYEYFISFCISIIFPCCMILLIPFITLYTSGITDINYIRPFYGFMTILTLASFCMRIPYLTVVQAAGKYKEVKIGAYLEAGINILSSIILTYLFGLIGVIIGTFLANTFRTIQYYLFISKEILNRKKYILLKNIAFISVSTVISYFLLKLVVCSGGISINSWGNWILAGIVSFVLSCIVFITLSLLFKKEDLTSFKKLFFR